jgi:cytoskeletal protein CcmA (bactofilin family)
MTDIHNDVLADEDFDTILSADIDFSGDVSFGRSMLVRGKLSGKIDADGMLLIDEGAVVHSDIKADKVVIRGEVHGNITASTSVNVSPTGKLHGNVVSPEVTMESGCVFNGLCSMVEIAAEPEK